MPRSSSPTTRMAEEVHELEERLSDLVHDMREVCVLAARSPREAEQMSSVLHVISRDRTDGERGRRRLADRHAPSRHPGRARCRSRRRRRGVAPGSGPCRVGPRAPLARRRGAAGGDRHARRGDPPRQGVDHRPRRRRHVPARRRSDPARAAGGHRASCASSRARRSGGAPPSRRIRRSPTSTAPSTCSSR